jgi:hypothetical protein
MATKSELMNHPTWTALRPGVTADHLGLVPSFFDLDDSRPARDQLNERYSHGGGWQPVRRDRIIACSSRSLLFRNDPSLLALADTLLREEAIVFYEGSWLSITQPDGSFEVARVD